MAAQLAYDALSMSGYSTNSPRSDHEITVLHGDLISADMAQWLAEKLRELRHAGAPMLKRFTVQCVNDQTMGELHMRHMNNPCTTDVLTFADGDDADVAVCVDEAARRATELNHQLRDELLLYCLHGLLHAGGMDDQTPAEFAAMHGEENRLLSAIGLGEIFGAIKP
ncbi:MAG: rRNA maturation RNase YbeY [Phycisphaerales bacterium]|nr:rRNA maturation RNase YbeY [Phycisphaerales bacterium]